MNCGKCNSNISHCVECGKVYAHGFASHCSMPDCMRCNAPLDCCGCGLVVSDGLDGVLTYNMNLIRYKHEA